MKSSFLDPIRRLLPTSPALVPAHAGGVNEPARFASTGGGGGGRFDDPDVDYYDDPETTETEETTRPARRPEQQATAARRRTVQSEPDDRYWTDYLRIALPVIGLLLVIAVFWFWAQRLIDDDTATDLTPTSDAGLAEVVDTATEPPAEAPGTPAQSDTSGDSGPAAQPTTDPAAQPTTAAVAEPTTAPEEPADAAGEDINALLDTLEGAEGEVAGGGGEIQPDSSVVVSADADTLNMRSAPTTAEDNVVAELTAGDTLMVVSGPQEAEGITWWEVVTDTGGQQGWVSAEFIEPAG